MSYIEALNDTISRDAFESILRPELPVYISHSPTGTSIIVSLQGEDIGALVVEVKDNKLVAYVWDEESLGNDPTTTVILKDLTGLVKTGL